MWSKLTLKQYYPWFLATGNLADPDGLAQAEADGVGAGANFGLTWRITERHRLAFTCRTPVRIDYNGDFRVNNVPGSLGGGTMGSGFKTSIKFPTILAVGYGIELRDRIRLETDVEWLQFSNFKSLPLNSVAAARLGFPSSVPENWRDTFTAGIGGDWKLAPDWILRAGYQFYQSPVPDSTFSPTIPDANQNVPTVGLGYTHKRHSIEAAYGLDFYNERNIRNAQNSAFNGKYQNTVHLFSFAYHYSF
jgi:long-chain fatty acid transport protein